MTECMRSFGVHLYHTLDQYQDFTHFGKQRHEAVSLKYHVENGWTSNYLDAAGLES